MTLIIHRGICALWNLQARVHQYQSQISKLQLENDSMRDQLQSLEATCTDEVHAKLLARLVFLETEHRALARDADAQRRQYERCLDDVANQVVRALLSQKVISTSSSFHYTLSPHFISHFTFSSYTHFITPYNKNSFQVNYFFTFQ